MRSEGRVLRHGQDNSVAGRGVDRRIYQPLLAEHVEEPRHADAHAHAGELLIRVVFGEVVIASTGADGTYLGVRIHHRLVHGAGVVVQAARNGEVDGEILTSHTQAGQGFNDRAQLARALGQSLVFAGVLV